MKIQVIGAGLIGSSIALRMKERGNSVWLEDKDAKNLVLAKDLIANSETEPDFFDLIIIATPISAMRNVIANLKKFNNNSTVIDIGGLKSKLLLEVEQFPDIAKIFVSAHPMAGREVSGSKSARADLFEGRAWLISATNLTSATAIEVAKDLGSALGATTYEISAEKHDQVIAAISHMPQLLSSLMGSLVLSEESDVLNFAGQGLRDISRLADSDSKLWSELVVQNSEKLIPKIETAIDLLKKLQNDLSTSNLVGIESFFESGKKGRGRIPGKHGAKPRNYFYLPIVIDDKPGQLAKIFDECAKCQVNVEDLSIEHSPNQEKGLITLALSESDARKLQEHMKKSGWQAQEIYS
jgi:prephenate dehydrogenase